MNKRLRLLASRLGRVALAYRLRGARLQLDSPAAAEGEVNESTD
jgi:hypothetical protein